jgi:uncharacterized protein
LEQLERLVELLRRQTGKIQLLVIQPTPFCNLDCSYCYLSDRTNKARMSLETLNTVLDRVAESGHLGEMLSIVWHAGEPLAMPRDWYAEAFASCREKLPRRLRIRHCFQSNGVLIDDAWCAFMRQEHVHLGISIDGPDFLHDRARRTRSGRGTHSLVMRGIERLRAADIPFHVISVLGRQSLDHADSIYDFFTDLRPTMLCFNVEEIEAANPRSSLAVDDVESAFIRFFDRILERQRMDERPLRIREVEKVLARLRHPAFPDKVDNAQATPLAIVSVDHQGRASTFSPELLGWVDDRLGPLWFADLNRAPLRQIVRHPGFKRIAAEIDKGVAACRKECAYFGFCGGGAPANKLAEHHRLDGTETMFCRLTEKRIVDRVLLALEHDLSELQQSSRRDGEGDFDRQETEVTKRPALTAES